jgi:hypothetical protein
MISLRRPARVDRENSKEEGGGEKGREREREEPSESKDIEEELENLTVSALKVSAWNYGRVAFAFSYLSLQFLSSPFMY